MNRKSVSELLGITDDVMFQNVMKDPINCQGFLQAVLPEIRIESVEVKTQERIGYDKKSKTAILDIWVKDDHGRLYDVEMQVANEHDLPMRARYYMHALDEDALHSGKKHIDLRPAYVIFIVPFDPKGHNYKDYRFTYLESRNKEIELGDKSEIIFLYTKGKIGDIQADLQDFFDLANGKSTSKRPFIEKIKESMERCRGIREWRSHSMNVEELLEQERQETIISSIKDFILTLRDCGFNDKEVYSKIIKRFGKKITADQLRELIKKTK